MSEITTIRDMIIQKIGSSFAVDRKQMARLIIDKGIDLKEILDILFMDHPVSTRFSWMFSDLVEIDKHLAPVLLEFAFNNREKIKALNFERVIAKQAYLCGNDIPEEIEGEILDWLFQLYADPKIQQSIKHYTKKALKNLIVKYPELQNEMDLMEAEQK